MVLGQIEWAMEDTSAGEVFRFIKSVEKNEVNQLLQNDLLAEKMVLSMIR